MELTILTNISQFHESKLTIFMQIISPDGPEMLANLTLFMQIRSPEMGLNMLANTTMMASFMLITS